jgi:hypothetical protein
MKEDVDTYREVLFAPGRHIRCSGNSYVTIDHELIQWCKDRTTAKWSYEIFLAEGWGLDALLRWQAQFLFENANDALLFKATHF